jgi:hypothetical protein
MPFTIRYPFTEWRYILKDMEGIFLFVGGNMIIGGPFIMPALQAWKIACTLLIMAALMMFLRVFGQKLSLGFRRHGIAFLWRWFSFKRVSHSVLRFISRITGDVFGSLDMDRSRMRGELHEARADRWHKALWRE